MADSAPAATQADPPKVSIRFLYSFCNDLAAVRKFYTECLGMQEVSAIDKPEFGWVSYRSTGLEYMFFRVDEPLPAPPAGFAAQPGGGGGERLVPSWSIIVPPETFQGVVKRLKAAGFTSNQPEPVYLQDSYWAYVVLDPCGNTIEVFTPGPNHPRDGSVD